MFLKYVIILCIIIHCSESQLNIYDIIRSVETKGLKIPCAKYLNGLNNLEEWAVRMLDATSKIPTGILKGNVMDLGSFDECIAIEHQSGDDLILGKYCGLAIIVTIPLDLLSMVTRKKMNATERFSLSDLDEAPMLLSICLPDSCNPSDLQPLVDPLIPELGGIKIKFSDALCQTKNSTPAMDGYDIFAIAFLSLIVIAIILSTSYDVFTRKVGRSPQHKLRLAFSAFTNGKKLISTHSHPDHLKCLDGIRFISTMWVIAGHRYFISGLLPGENMLDHLLKWNREVYSQYIQGFLVAVNTFMCISGTVLAYTFMNNQSKPHSQFNVFIFYIQRYLRLTPVMGVLYLLVISLIKYLSSGPFWIAGISFMRDNCLQYWWTYFLHIQNYVNNSFLDMCLPNTLYMSMDMQIILISPLILLPLVKYQKQTKYALYALVVVFIIVPFVICYEYELKILSENYYKYYYFATHARVAPWFVGLLMGSFMHEFKNRHFKIHWMTNLTIWIFILSGMAAVVFTGNDIMYNFENVKTAIYTSLHGVAWSLGLCWIIFACVKGHGGVVNWFLSLPMFQVLAKITYSMYVTFIGVVMLQVGRLQKTRYVSDYDLFYEFCGDLIMTMSLATVWTLAFEMPIIEIGKHLFGGHKRKSNL